MSSHHIVRESQEPALLFLQSDHLGGAHIGPLLEWSPSVVVMEPALQKVAASGIKIDVVIFPADRASSVQDQVRFQNPVLLLPYGKQEDPLLNALHQIAGNGQKSVNILLKSAAGDENLLKTLALQNIIKNVVLLDDKEKWALCRSGNFSKWYPGNEKTGVVPVADEPTFLTSGLKDDLKDTRVNGRRNFRTLQTGTISINSKAPFWIIEPLF